MPRPSRQPAPRRPGRPPAEEGDGAATRSAILRSAWVQFNSQSYTSLTMDSLAKAAGLTKATLYYHFVGKAELFVATVRAMLDELVVATEALRDDRAAPTRERLARLVALWYGPESDEYNMAMMEEAVAHLPAMEQGVIHEALDRFNEPIIAIMAEGVAAGDLRPLDPRLLFFAFQQLFADIDYTLLGATTRAERLAAQQALLELFLVGAASAD